MADVNLIDVAFHAGDLAGLLVIIAVLWTKLGAVEKAFEKHVDLDEERFEASRRDRHEIRNSVNTVAGRVSTLEGRLSGRLVSALTPERSE